MGGSIVSQVVQGVAQLGRMVEPASKQVWTMYLKQSVAYGYMDLYGAIICVVTLVVGMLLLKAGFKVPAGYEYDDRRFALYIIGGIIAGVSLTLILTLSISGFFRLYNPPYFAINDIMNMIHGGNH